MISNMGIGGDVVLQPAGIRKRVIPAHLPHLLDAWEAAEVDFCRAWGDSSWLDLCWIDDFSIFIFNSSFGGHSHVHGHQYDSIIFKPLLEAWRAEVAISRASHEAHIMKKRRTQPSLAADGANLKQVTTQVRDISWPIASENYLAVGVLCPCWPQRRGWFHIMNIFAVSF